MPDESDYSTSYESETANGDGADSDLLVYENTYKARLSNLHITGPDAQDFEVVVRDQDGSNSTTKKFLANVQDANLGNFDDPVLEWGANQELAIINSSALSADDYGINAVIDELIGE